MDDPYPIALQNPAATPQHETTQSGDYSDTQPHPLDRPRQIDEDLPTLRSRIIYQTRKRGTLETGILLSTWMPPERIRAMDRSSLEELERLMSVPEWTLFYWSVARTSFACSLAQDGRQTEASRGQRMGIESTPTFVQFDFSTELTHLREPQGAHLEQGAQVAFDARARLNVECKSLQSTLVQVLIVCHTVLDRLSDLSGQRRRSRTLRRLWRRRDAGRVLCVVVEALPFVKVGDPTSGPIEHGRIEFVVDVLAEARHDRFGVAQKIRRVDNQWRRPTLPRYPVV